MTGEAADVHLVHDGLRRRSLQRRVALPIVGGDVDDHVLHGRPDVVARASRRIPTIGFGDHDGSAIGIEQNFGRIESLAARRI